MCYFKKKYIKCNIYESSKNKNTIIDKNNERVIYITLVEINEKFYKKEFNEELNILLLNFYNSIVEILDNQYFKSLPYTIYNKNKDQINIKKNI